MRDKFFSRIASFVTRRALLTLGIGIVVTVIMGALAGTISISNSWVDLLPSKHKQVDAFKEMSEKLGSTDFFIAMIESGDREEARRVSDELTGLFLEDKEIEYVFNKVDLPFYRRQMLLYLSPEELEQLRGGLAALASLDEQAAVQQLRDELKTFDEETMKAFGFGYDKDGYLFSENGDYLLVLAQPVTDMYDLSWTVPFCRKMEKNVKTLDEKYPDTRILLGGNYYFAYEEKVTVDNDMMLVAILALIVVVALFVIFFRSWSYPLLSLLCLIMAIVWTLGVMNLVFGQLNFITSILAAMLLGIGVDYSIHVLSRYKEEMQRHSDSTRAWITTFKHTGKGVLTGAVTTAAAMFLIMLGDSRAFIETGLFLGVGVLFCFISVVLFLPAMIVLKEKKWPMKTEKIKGKMPLLGKLGGFSSKHFVIIILVVLVLSGLFGYGVTKVAYEYDMYAIEPEGISSKIVNDKLVEQFNMSLDGSVLFTDDIDEVKMLADQFRGVSTVGKVESVVDLVPQDVDEKMAIIKGIKESFYATGFYKTIEGTDLGNSVNQLLEVQPLGIDSLPEDMRKRFITGDGEYVIYVYPKEDPWDEAFLAEYIKTTRKVDERIHGAPTIYHDAVNSLKDDFGTVTLYSLIAIFVLVLLDFKRLGRAVFAFLPLGIAVLWMVGLMGLINFKFDIVNIMVTPMVIGLGIDYGVIVLHRYIEEGETPNGIPGTLEGTGRAVLVSGLTTIGVFGTLLLARYRGFQHLGLTAAIGLTFSVLGAIIVLPSILTGVNWIKEKLKKA
ncbi:MAG: MMPL family transporter [Actinobacteria bacterium]|nr:MMPL family transporter [Actinomycetota bacterium]